ncbi:MAG: hypothetical protein K9W44_00695 [Candidatus Lokiarchaeota archaeon]|nr:hypothetical protein [Candidatus Harpocratesius repetitus]
MSNEHFFCPRCGSILIDFPNKPEICPRCGGVEIIDIGKEGDYQLKHLRKEYHAPFRSDVYFKYF